MTTYRNTTLPQSRQDSAHRFQLQLLGEQVDEHVSDTMNINELADEVIPIFVEVIGQPFGAHACRARFECCTFDQLRVIVNSNAGDWGEAAGVDVV